MRVRKPTPLRLIAYDYETTKILAGTPQPRYITAFGVMAPMQYESPIDSMQHLALILKNNFLLDQYLGCAFVAWNGNNFDAYFTAAALVTDPEYIMRPYLTRGRQLRGLKVMRRSDFEIEGDRARGWQFLDGIAMLGLVGVPLAKLLETFAPHLPKLVGTIDFDVEEFDPKNAQHRAYAMRDSVGLEFAMRRAQEIMLKHFDQSLTVTMGGACIRILKAHIPEEVTVRPSKPELRAVIRQHAMRGGYCHCARRYTGPVWKYDLNQAYASAMRETRLPCGNAFRTSKGVNKYAQVYVARITGTNPGNRIPFYCRAMVDGRIRAVFAMEAIPDTWICSSEVEQLQREGWALQIHESWTWEEHFNLKDYVDKLEDKRSHCEGGPSGSEGTMIKNVGNHSYGKTLEELEAVEFLLSSACPPGFVPVYNNEDADPLDHLWERHIDDMKPKDYHQPQLGSFITAHVRMVVRRAALVDPAAWLYADTDCVMFSRDVTDRLDIDPKRYGAWKIEESGAVYQVIAKKVYTQLASAEVRAAWDDPDPVKRAATRKKIKRSAKGLHVKYLTPEDFDGWAAGTPPAQSQVQRNNFMKVMQGAEMYRSQHRKGTAIKTP